MKLYLGALLLAVIANAAPAEEFTYEITATLTRNAGSGDSLNMEGASYHASLIIDTNFQSTIVNDADVPYVRARFSYSGGLSPVTVTNRPGGAEDLRLDRGVGSLQTLNHFNWDGSPPDNDQLWMTLATQAPPSGFFELHSGSEFYIFLRNDYWTNEQNAPPEYFPNFGPLPTFLAPEDLIQSTEGSAFQGRISPADPWTSYGYADFSITILGDSDGDGIRNSEDAFPTDPTEWIDTDGDGVGNNADSDDDNDGMPDTYEIDNGFDPLDSSDAGGDADGDGYSNIVEYRRRSDLNDPNSIPQMVMPWITILLDSRVPPTPLPSPPRPGEGADCFHPIDPAHIPAVMADLVNCDMSDQDLSDLVLVMANMNGAIIRRSSLVSVDLSEAIMIDVAGRGVDLTNANLHRANLTGADLGSGTGSGETSLRFADLTEAILVNTDLRGANLSNSILWVGADLTGAIIYFVDFSGADLTGATGFPELALVEDILSMTWSNTTCPDGVNSDDTATDFFPFTCLEHFLP